LGLTLLQEVFIKRRLAFTKAISHGLIASGLAIGKNQSSCLENDETIDCFL
jgi:hypothetical protein